MQKIINYLQIDKARLSFEKTQGYHEDILTVDCAIPAVTWI